MKRLTVEDVADENICEEAHAGNTTVRMGTPGLLGVQCVEERSLDEVSGPNHGRRRDEEAFANAADREANQLGRHD
jgi:hypothetical protein